MHCVLGSPLGGSASASASRARLCIESHRARPGPGPGRCMAALQHLRGFPSLLTLFPALVAGGCNVSHARVCDEGGASRGPLARNGQSPIERSGARERTPSDITVAHSSFRVAAKRDRALAISITAARSSNLPRLRCIPILNAYLLRRSHRPGLMRPVRGY